MARCQPDAQGLRAIISRCTSTAQRVDDAGELDEQPVASGLDNPAAMLLDLGIAQLTSDRLQFGERPLLVRSLRKNMNVIYDAD